MSKNNSRIREAIKAIARQPYEIQSGTVVPGSVNTSDYTVSVLPSEGGKAIEGVMLNSTSANASGVIIVPSENSNVVIGTVDGPGEWAVLKAGTIEKVIVKIGNVNCLADNTKVTVQNGSVLLDVGAGTFKMNTASESLFQLLKDLITATSAMSFTSFSSPAVNATTLTALLPRLNALLSA